MFRIRSRPASRSLAVFCLAFVVATSAGAEPQTSQGVFEALCVRVEQAAAAGDLPASAASAAEEARFALRKELIRSDAEIEILKLEAARFAGAEQQQALERLIRAAAARERRVCVAIRQLEELAGMSVEISAAPAATAAELPAAEGEVAEGEEKAKGRGLKIVFESEDLVDNPDS